DLCIEARPLETRDVEPIAAVPGNVDAVGRDHPGSRLTQALGSNEQNADEIVCENEDAALPSVFEREPRAVGGYFSERCGDERLHEIRLYLLHDDPTLRRDRQRGYYE